MDTSYIIILIVIPIAMFFCGFLIARQLRALENVPLFSMMFVQRRLLFSFVMGFSINLIFLIIFGLVTRFTVQLFFGFIGIFLLTTFCYYFGVTFGWGSSSATSEGITTTNSSQINTAFPENIIVQNSLGSMKIIISTKKRWGFFVMEAFQWIVMGLCLLPIAGLAVISFLQNFLPESIRFLVWLLVAGLVLYLLYIKSLEAIEFVYDKEIIEIDNLSVRIEKYGSKLSNKKEYSAENIKMITTMFSVGRTHAVLKRSPFVNSNMPAFIMLHIRGVKRYRTFGRAIDLVDAQRILETIYSKFPQYKG